MFCCSGLRSVSIDETIVRVEDEIRMVEMRIKNLDYLHVASTDKAERTENNESELYLSRALDCEDEMAQMKHRLESLKELREMLQQCIQQKRTQFYFLQSSQSLKEALMSQTNVKQVVDKLRETMPNDVEDDEDKDWVDLLPSAPTHKVEVNNPSKVETRKNTKEMLLG